MLFALPVSGHNVMLDWCIYFIDVYSSTTATLSKIISYKEGNIILYSNNIKQQILNCKWMLGMLFFFYFIILAKCSYSLSWLDLMRKLITPISIVLCQMFLTIIHNLIKLHLYMAPWVESVLRVLILEKNTQKFRHKVSPNWVSWLFLVTQCF